MSDDIEGTAHEPLHTEIEVVIQRPCAPCTGTGRKGKRACGHCAGTGQRSTTMTMTAFVERVKEMLSK